MAVSVSAFGEIDGRRVDSFRLESAAGVAIDILAYGVVVRDWRVPVAGIPRGVVLGFDSFDAYPLHSPYFGAVVGRVANRIGGARFTLGGRVHDLPANVPGKKVHLHGGPEGLARQLWIGEPDSAANAVRFTHLSPDGAMGYPGTVRFEALYSLDGHRLRLDLAATTDAPTPISLVQHHYFNLGTGPDVLDHRVQIAASAYTELDGDLVPTGAILPVAGTPYDLRAPRILRDAEGRPDDYDIGLVLDTGRDLSEPAATVTAPDGAPTLRLWTDRPGLQLYNGVWTDVPVPGLGGRRYGRYSGLCLEDQALADAVSHPHFPSIVYTPDRPYRHRCEIEIG